MEKRNVLLNFIGKMFYRQFGLVFVKNMFFNWDEILIEGKITSMELSMEK